jgi:hypothetical protein
MPDHAQILRSYARDFDICGPQYARISFDLRAAAQALEDCHANRDSSATDPADDRGAAGDGGLHHHRKACPACEDD